MQTADIFTAGYRFKLTAWAVVTLLLGAVMFFYPYIVFGYLVTALPWALLGGGVFCGLKTAALRRRRKKYFRSGWLAAVLLGAGGVLLWQTVWVDTVLWYIFALYLLISGWQNLRPVWIPGLEKQIWWRYAGSLTVWGFVLLMLLKPRSGLSEALMMLSLFFISWGIFQLLLPPPQE